MSQSAFPYKVINSNWDYTDVGCCQKSVTQPPISHCMLDFADGRDLFKGVRPTTVQNFTGSVIIIRYSCRYFLIWSMIAWFCSLCNWLRESKRVWISVFTFSGIYVTFCQGYFMLFLQSLQRRDVRKWGKREREREMGKDMQQKSPGSQTLRLMVGVLTLRPPGRSPSATTLIINQFLSKSAKHTLVPASRLWIFYCFPFLYDSALSIFRF